MRIKFLYRLFLLVFLGAACQYEGKSQDPQSAGNSSRVQFWLTSPADQVLFQRKEDISFSPALAIIDTSIIDVNARKTYQAIDGFGNCLTDGSAMLLNMMNVTERKAILNELFSFDACNIGISYLRISLGASDLSEVPYSYDDLPSGETDFELEKFTLDQSRKNLIPVLRQILSINPQIKIMASPWSPPPWMKTNNDFKGGSLRPECYDVYARYFVRYLTEMKSEGIVVDAITIQNEPLHPGNVPSMYMTAADQARFIKQNLGPALEKAGLSTKIVVYDHNADRIDYPLAILRDPEAAKFVDGSAFHLYGGKIEALDDVHKEFPGKNLYFTEQWIGAPGDLAKDFTWHTGTLIIGATRNWCRTVLEWNLASDPGNNPHTIGGCDRCLGTITINGNMVHRNPAYYILAQAAKFVRPGSFRIESALQENLPNVAFKTGEGKIVLIVLNDGLDSRDFVVRYCEKFFKASLKKGSAATFVW